MKAIKAYLKSLQIKLNTKTSTEHTFREDLSNLLKQLINDNSIQIINEPQKIKNIGIPDFLVLKNNLPIGYIETKNINKDLSDKTFKKQFEKYIKALNNLIITNYLHFQLYKNSEKVAEIKIADFEEGKIKPIKNNFKAFESLIKEFIKGSYLQITSPSDLAKIMADKTKLLKELIYQNLTQNKETTLLDEFKAFKVFIIHDITEKEFADIYAQTIVYGLFLARYNDPTKDTFTREEARKLIPNSHPFLRGLFSYISDDTKIETSIKWVIDDIVEIFRKIDLHQLFKEHTQDPIIYFYEDFLKEYDPSTRKSRGVWYTPKPVVEFIVKSTEEVLKNEFNLDGYNDESVYILDPACGTGTFLSKVVEHIKQNFLKENYPQFWSEFAEKHLIPRLNGFEIIMASYAMAHLKMEIVLQEKDYKPQSRINIYLTNALEPPNEIDLPLFFAYMAQEVKMADKIKKEYPIMVVMGNPPYNANSINSNKWINNLLQDYKKEYTGEPLKEKNPKWINDDYVKFIRLAQWYIEKNKKGIVSYITAHGFLDNPTFRGMRYSLLKSFDKIYILNLHGNTRKKETSPDLAKDENVFDIQQGVSINIFVKTTNSKKLAEVYYFDLWGKREDKYKFLEENTINTVNWQKINPQKPMFYFIPKDDKLEREYEKGFSLNEVFKEKSTGIVSGRDNLLIGFTKEEVINKLILFFRQDKEFIKSELGLKENKRFKIDEVKQKTQFNEKFIIPIHYRPFDIRYIYYDEVLLERSRKQIMQHFINKENTGLVYSREATNEYWSNIQIVNGIIDNRFHFSAKGTSYISPLYLYQNNQKTLNLKQEFIKTLEKKLKLTFNKDFNELHIIDYIYAYLHKPDYREKYKEFLKIDFPKVPYPKNKKQFFTLANYGEKLRKIHLLEDKDLNKKTVEIIGKGKLTIENSLTKKDIKEENEYIYAKINQQITLKIPKTAFNFQIGGYKPAQKYLKDRKNRTLTLEEFTHYNKIINALIKTDKIMEKLLEV